jgi:hypothetical protein
LYVGGELSNEIQMAELPRWAFVPFLLEGVGDGLMVSEDEDEVARFQHVAEMLHGLVDSEQLPILGAAFLLCQVELLGEECEGMPGVVDKLLQYGTHGGSGGVCDECKWMRLGRGAPVEWRVTPSPCTLQRPCGDPASRSLDERP